MKKILIFLMIVVAAITTFAQTPDNNKFWTKSKSDIRYPQISQLVDPTSDIDSIASVVTINAQTVSYTATVSDLGKTITINSASATTFTIPLFSVAAFPVGATINVVQLGAGDVTIAITATGTLQSESSWVKIGAQYSGVTLLKLATDTWIILGRLKA